MQDVLQRFRQLAGARRGLRLYALVDGFQYHQHTGQWIEYRPKETVICSMRPTTRRSVMQGRGCSTWRCAAAKTRRNLGRLNGRSHHCHGS
jgi:hypothetical protein